MRTTVVAAVAGTMLLGGAIVGYWHVLHSQPASRFESAWLSLRAGRLKEVREQLEHLGGHADFQVHRQILRAGLLCHAGRADAALQQLTTKSNDEALLSKILQLRGECLYMLGEYLDARAVFLMLAELKPNDPDPHRALAAVYFDLGYLTPSTEELRTAIKLDPTDARAHRMLGRIELEADHHQQAIEHYRVALEKLAAPDRDEVIVEMATAQVRLQQFQRAAVTLKSVSKSSVNALVLQAECERSLGHVAKAHEILNSALSISKTSPKACLLRAQWHLEDKEPEQAIALLLEVLAESPFDMESRYVIARAYRRLGDNERATAETQRWEELRDLEVELDKLQHMMWRNPRDEASRLRLIEIAPKIGKQRIAEFWSRAGRT